MNKVTLIKFIKRCSLGSSVESIKIIANKDKITCDFSTIDKSVIGFLEHHDSKLPDGDYCVYDISKLLSILSIFEDQIDFDVIKNASNINVSLLLKSKKTKAIFGLSDPINIPPAPKISNLPSFEFELKLTPELIKTILNSCGAIDSESIYVIQDDDELQFLIGDGINSNSNKIIVNTDQKFTTKLNSNIKFSSNHLLEILRINNDITECTLKLSTKGLMELTFEYILPIFKGKYYLTRS